MADNSTTGGIFSISLLNSGFECRIIFNQVIGQVILGYVMKNSCGFN